MNLTRAFLGLALCCVTSAWSFPSLAAPASQLSAHIQLVPKVKETLKWDKQAQVVLQFQQEHLQTLFKSIAASDDFALDRLVFEPEQQQYRLDLTAAGDSFSLLIRWPRPEQMAVQVTGNWIPSDMILGKLEEQLQKPLQTLTDYGLQARASLKNNAGKSELQLHFLSQHSHLKWSGYIDQQGTWFINLTPAGHRPQTASVDAAQKGVQLAFKGQLNSPAEQELRATVSHKAFIHLEPHEIKHISFAGEDLYRRVEGLTGVLTGNSAFVGNLAKGQWQGRFNANLSRVQLKGHTYKGLSSYPILWQFQVPYDNFLNFKVWPELPDLKADRQKLAQVPFYKGRLQYSIDGPDYLTALRAAVKQATHSVQQEVFVFYTGETTRKLARLYLLKAAGLQENNAKITADAFAPRGVVFEIMHNHGLSQKGAAKVKSLFENEQLNLFKDLAKQGFSTQEQSVYKKRIQRHLQIRALTRGVLKIDHRKQVLIDKTMAFVGGFNLGDHYLSDRGFHDIMYAITGPITQSLQKAFQHNWQALAQENPFVPLNLPKFVGPKSIFTDPLVSSTINLNVLKTSHSQPFFKPEMALLLHDHDQNLIQPAILELIQGAKHTLRLEQAYFNHPQVLAALKAAKARGVNIEIIMSYYNDEGMFERLNLANMLELKTAVGNGKVRCWLYRGKDKNNPADRKNPAYMVHSKYISADEKEAIVGSTNLIPRSLQSPFYGLEPEHYPLSPAFFNEEIALWIKDRQTVTALDQDLVKKDAQQRSIEVNAAKMRELIQERGGKWKLLVDRLKGLVS